MPSYREDLATVLRLLERSTAAIGADGMHVQVYDVSDDVLAEILVAGGTIEQLSGNHVASLSFGRVRLSAWGKRKGDIDARPSVADETVEMLS